MSDPDVADQLRNWRAECDDTLSTLAPLLRRLNGLLAGSTITVEFAPSTDAEILATIAEGLIPAHVVRITIVAHFDVMGANWIADVIERGLERR